MSSKPRLAILDDYQHVALTSSDWTGLQSRLHIDVYDDTLLEEDELAKRLYSYQIVCTMRERTKFPASLFEKLPNLKLLTTTGMRNRSIDLDAAHAKGVVVSGTGGKGNSTLEHIWALILATARFVVKEDANIKAPGKAPWQSSIPLGLSEATLGLIGLGGLGLSTAKIAKAFNMRVVAWSPHLTKERADEAGVEFASTKDALLKQSDIVSLHMVLSPTTYRMITAEDFANMKPSAFFINTSRGPLIDEAALVEVLRGGKIAGAGLDVFDIEPLPLDHPLRSLSNVTLSPHLGYVSHATYEAFWGQTVENIAAFLEDKPIRVIS